MLSIVKRTQQEYINETLEKATHTQSEYMKKHQLKNMILYLKNIISTTERKTFGLEAAIIVNI